jgi:antitoxin (DNA-binding transcriptional repressor) of toxin-antitoxin stability system
MLSVNIAELKNRLSAYQHVRAGEEILIRDRNLPIAKLVPLSPAETSAEELTLVASGRLTLPDQELDEEAFWAIGSQDPIEESRAAAIRRAVSEDREERDDSFLGR